MIVSLPLETCPRCHRRWRKPARICDKCAAHGRIVVGYFDDRQFPCHHYIRAHGRDLWLCSKCDVDPDLFTRSGVRRWINIAAGFCEIMNLTQSYLVNFAYFNWREVEEPSLPLSAAPIPIEQARKRERG